MNPQVEKLVRYLDALPDAAQSRIAARLLEDAREAAWEESLARPESRIFLDALIAEALDDLEQGRTSPKRRT